MHRHSRPCLPADSYIDFWEIDLNYDGKVFNSDLQVIRSGRHTDSSLPLHITTRCKKPRTPIHIAVKVHDVFGDTAMEIAQLYTGPQFPGAWG